MVATYDGDRRGRRSVLAIPLESSPGARSSPASRIPVPGTLTVRGCPAATDGLDNELARLQDRGTGGMAPLAIPPVSAGSTVPNWYGPSLGPMRAGPSPLPYVAKGRRLIRSQRYSGR
jgi:hypothetical protein